MANHEARRPDLVLHGKFATDDPEIPYRGWRELEAQKKPEARGCLRKSTLAVELGRRGSAAAFDPVLLNVQEYDAASPELESANAEEAHRRMIGFCGCVPTFKIAKKKWPTDGLSCAGSCASCASRRRS